MTTAFLDVKFSIVAAPTPVPSALPFITPERRAIWAKMVADKNPLMALSLKAAAQPGSVWGDFGQHAAIAYQVTGNAAYAQASYTKLLAMLSVASIDPNNLRAYFAEIVLFYTWIHDQLTADQRTAFETQLKRWCDYGIGFGTTTTARAFRSSDTDQTIGTYGGLVACALLVPGFESYLNAQLYLPGSPPTPVAGQAVGGLDGAAQTPLMTMRNTIWHYCDLARYGVWPTWSSEYDPGDLTLLILVSRLVNFGASRDCFPEVTALIPKLIDHLAFEFTPDIKTIYEHGDDETARSVHWWDYDTYIRVLQGFDPSNGFIDHVMKSSGSQPQGGSYRALFWCNPYAPIAAYTEARGERWSPSIGDTRWRNPDSDMLAAFRWPLYLNVDHQYNVGDHQVYSGGEWKVTRPIGYAIGPRAMNATLLFGLPSMLQRAIVAHGSGADFCWFTGNSAGPYYTAGFANPPETFVNSWQHTEVFLDSGIIVTRDEWSMTADPRTLPKFTRYNSVDQAMAKQATAAIEVLRHCPVTPTIAGNVATWNTPGGTPIRVTALSSDQLTLSVVDETVLWPGTSGGLVASEKKFHLLIGDNALTGSLITVTCIGQTPELVLLGNKLAIGARAMTFNNDGTVTVA